MKLKNLLAYGILSVVLGACSYEPDEMVVEVDQSYPIQLFNEIEQVATTRVNDEGFCDGDGVGIYVVNYDGGVPGQLVVEGNQADNVRYVYDEANGKWIPNESVYFRDKNTHVDIIGYYPYGSPSSVDAYAFEVAKDQSTEAANGLLGGYEASDFLWGKAADIAPTSQRIAVKFQHRMAGVLVTLSEGTGFDTGEFAQLEKSVLVTNTIRKAVIDLSTGEVFPTGEVPTTGTVPYKRDGNFRAVVVPQTVAASTPLFSITVDGVPYVFRKSEPFSYMSGKLHKFTIEVSKKSASGLEFKLLGESITAWETDNISHDATAREYIIVDCPEPGTLKECITAAGKDYTKVKNLKVTGTIDQRDFEMMRDEMTALQSLNLREVEIAKYGSSAANEIPYRAFDGKSTLIRFVFPENITRIGERAFWQTNISGSLIIPNSVTEILSAAFWECGALSGTLTLPKSLIAIRSSAFRGCAFVGELHIPQTVKIIEKGAFEGCKGFTGNLILPDGLLELSSGSEFNSGAFWGCSGFTGSLSIPSKIKEIEAGCFAYCTGFDGQLELPKDLIGIKEYAFQECQFRGSLDLPDGLSYIGVGAFQFNMFSTELKLPQSLSVIQEKAFAGCSRLSGVVELPNDLISVAPSLFEGCSNLEGVLIPKNVEVIRENAFLFCICRNLKKRKTSTPIILG